MTTIDDVVSANAALESAFENLMAVQAIAKPRNYKGMSFAMEEAGDDAAVDSRKSVIQRLKDFIKRIVDWFANLRKKRTEAGKDEETAVQVVEERAKKNAQTVNDACSSFIKSVVADAKKSGIDGIPDLDASPDHIGEKAQNILSAIASKAKAAGLDKEPVKQKADDKPGEVAQQATSVKKDLSRDPSTKLMVSITVMQNEQKIREFANNKILETYNRNKDMSVLVSAVASKDLSREFDKKLRDVSRGFANLKLAISSATVWEDSENVQIQIPDFDLEIPKKELTSSEYSSLIGTAPEFYISRWTELLTQTVVKNYRQNERELDKKIEEIQSMNIPTDKPELAECVKHLNEAIVKMAAVRAKVNKFIDQAVAVAQYLVSCDASIISDLRNPENSMKLAEELTASMHLSDPDGIKEVMATAISSNALLLMGHELLTTMGVVDKTP